MKRILPAIVLLTVLLVACHKNQNNPSSPAPIGIAGLWQIDSVTTYFYDSTGLGLRGVKGYAYSGFYYNFHSDSSWVETLQDTSANGVTNGTYSVTSDTTFTLIYANAPASSAFQPCKIAALTNKLFIFSKQRPTVFNGTEPGFIKYVFRLAR